MDDSESYIKKVLDDRESNEINTKLSILDYYLHSLKEAGRIVSTQKIYDFFYYNLIYIEKLLFEQPSESLLKHMLLYSFIYHTDYFVTDLIAYANEGTIDIETIGEFIGSIYGTIIGYIDNIISNLETNALNLNEDYSNIKTANELAMYNEGMKKNHYNYIFDSLNTMLPFDDIGSNFQTILKTILLTHFDNLYNWPNQYEINKSGVNVEVFLPDEIILKYQNKFMNLLNPSLSTYSKTKQTDTRQSQFKFTDKPFESRTKRRDTFASTQKQNRTLKLNNNRIPLTVSQGGKKRSKTRKQKRKKMERKRRRKTRKY